MLIDEVFKSRKHMTQNCFCVIKGFFFVWLENLILFLYFHLIFDLALALFFQLKNGLIFHCILNSLFDVSFLNLKRSSGYKFTYTANHLNLLNKIISDNSLSRISYFTFFPKSYWAVCWLKSTYTSIRSTENVIVSIDKASSK